MRIAVTDQGVLIPKEWLPDVREVDIQKDDDVIVVKPTFARDPIQGWGKSLLNAAPQMVPSTITIIFMVPGVEAAFS